jgi:hypothetical protein
LELASVAYKTRGEGGKSDKENRILSNIAHDNKPRA